MDRFAEFLATTTEENQFFLMEMDSFLAEKKCKCDIKETKQGFLVTYTYPNSKKTLFNLVNRKNGVKARIYAAHVEEYEDFIDTLPGKVKAEIMKAPDCKRLHNPDDCNPRCSMGYTFTMDGTLCKKCRYSAFMPTLNMENNSYIKGFIERELDFA